MNDVGKVLDKYELLERVGQGGMAIVYRGLDRSLRRQVAVKVLHRHLADHDEARHRFEREAQAVAKLRHENILEIFDYSGKAGGESYIVTEFIDGKTLKEAITEHAPRFAEIGAMIVVQICRALVHAHGQGILHRDVKPENVMIRSDGVIKLTDFGISQMVDAQRMTMTGHLLGSPAYMSPEHVEGRPLDFRTDIFALGIVLYQLTVGTLPFEGKNPHEILKRIAECRFADPRHANPRVGNELGLIILKAMAQDPAARYQAVAAMLADLEHYLEVSGLGPAKDELARYFASPAAYEQALRSRLVGHLLQAARANLPSRRAYGLELLNRVLTIDPRHAGANQLLLRLTRLARWQRAGAIAAVLGLAGGGAWGVRRWLTSQESATTIGRASDAPEPPEIADAAARNYSPAIPPNAAARTTPAMPPDAARGPVDGTTVLQAPLDAIPSPTPHDRAAPHRVAIARPPPPEPAALAVPARTYVLTVSPPDAEVRIGQAGWQRFARGRVELPVPLHPTTVTVRNNACCEAEFRTIGPDVGPTVAIQLGFRPALITPRCSRPGVTVEIDDVAARLGQPTTIPFTGTLSTKTIKVDFVASTAIETQRVRLKAAEERTVTCGP